MILGVQVRLNRHIMQAERDQFNRVIPNIEWYNIFDDELPSLDKYDAVLIGGSGKVSLSKKDDNAAYAMKTVHNLLDNMGGKRVVGVCLGYHLIGQYHGSTVVQDAQYAETGTITLRHNLQGVPNPMLIQCGHNDSLDKLPDGAELLATSDVYPLQMFRIGNMYAIQAHPEQCKADLEERLQHFSQYADALSNLQESPDAGLLLQYCFR